MDCLQSASAGFPSSRPSRPNVGPVNWLKARGTGCRKYLSRFPPARTGRRPLKTRERKSAASLPALADVTGFAVGGMKPEFPHRPIIPIVRTGASNGTASRPAQQANSPNSAEMSLLSPTCKAMAPAPSCPYCALGSSLSLLEIIQVRAPNCWHDPAIWTPWGIISQVRARGFKSTPTRRASRPISRCRRGGSTDSLRCEITVPCTGTNAGGSWVATRFLVSRWQSC